MWHLKTILAWASICAFNQFTKRKAGDNWAKHGEEKGRGMSQRQADKAKRKETPKYGWPTRSSGFSLDSSKQKTKQSLPPSLASIQLFRRFLPPFIFSFLR
jgi:hypothetical protein